MAQRSGVFTKYVVAFRPTGLTVSSDARAGDLCLDARIDVRMSRGLAGAAFEIRLYDLPETSLHGLCNAFPAHAGDGVPLPRVRILLGYLDTDMAPVMQGICEQVHSGIEGDRRVTTVRGREAATWACGVTPCPRLDGTPMPPGALVARVMALAPFPADCVDAVPELSGPLPARVGELGPLSAWHVLGALDEIAGRTGCELLVGEGRVRFGRCPGSDCDLPKLMDRSLNLVAFEPLTLALAGQPRDAVAGWVDRWPAEPPSSTRVSAFRFKVLGDPGLRPGQAVLLVGVEGHAGMTWLVRHLEHRYSTAEGYVCTGVATLPLEDGHLGRGVDLLTEHNAAGAARAVLACLGRMQAGPAAAAGVAAGAASGSEAGTGTGPTRGTTPGLQKNPQAGLRFPAGRA